MITNSEGYKIFPLSHPVFDLEDVAIIIDEYIKDNMQTEKDMVELMKKFAKYGLLMQGEEHSTVLTGHELFKTFYG